MEDLMAHTSEECARRVINVFKDFGIRGNECLMSGSFTNYFVQRPLRMDDLNTGLQEAVGRGWITSKDGNAIFLTEAGEAEIA
jgi:hypothetical protein